MGNLLVGNAVLARGADGKVGIEAELLCGGIVFLASPEIA